MLKTSKGQNTMTPVSPHPLKKASKRCNYSGMTRALCSVMQTGSLHLIAEDMLATGAPLSLVLAFAAMARGAPLAVTDHAVSSDRPTMSIQRAAFVATIPVSQSEEGE